MDISTTDRLAKVHPHLRELVTKLIERLDELAFDVRVVQGLRTADEQQKLYNQGRTTKGQIVTYAKPLQSNHNFGLAVDLCPFVNGQPDWNDINAFLIIGREAKKLGLEWGGDWRHRDMPHVQLKGMSIKECQKAYTIGRLSLVWARMDEVLSGSVKLFFIPDADELLEFGDKGEQVVKLQKRLADLKLLRPHEVDGVFGTLTKNAVIAFQRLNDLTADGIVGDGSKAKLGL